MKLLYQNMCPSGGSEALPGLMLATYTSQKMHSILKENGNQQYQNSQASRAVEHHKEEAAIIYAFLTHKTSEGALLS